VMGRHDYLPFGDEIPGGVAGRSSQFGPYVDNVNQKFTGQYRDSETSNDFFNARYFSAPLMRFLSADPAGLAAVDITDPQTWNQYAYVRGNPLNSVDPSGMCGGIVAGIGSDPYRGGGRSLLQIAAQYGYDIAYPYAGQSKLAGIFSVLGQSWGFKNSATAVAGAMAQDVKAQTGETGGSSFFGLWSGGAASAQLAGVDPSVSSYYQVYFSPGGALLPTNNPNALMFSGSGVLDTLVNATSSGPVGSAAVSYPGSAGCGHDAACMWNTNQSQIDSLLNNGAIPSVQNCPNPTVFLPHGVTIPLQFSFTAVAGEGSEVPAR
jgi:RHS repeat-associated protein